MVQVRKLLSVLLGEPCQGQIHHCVNDPLIRFFIHICIHVRHSKCIKTLKGPYEAKSLILQSGPVKYMFVITSYLAHIKLLKGVQYVVYVKTIEVTDKYYLYVNKDVVSS